MLQSEQDRWREQWSHCYNSIETERPLLRKWLSPLTLDEIRGLDVLDAGCGNGMHTAILAEAGARSVTALDYASWREANSRFGHLPHVNFGFHDLDAGPPSGSYDLVVCIGVLPHVRNPARVVGHLTSVVRAGGQVLIWATVRESNTALLWFDRFKRPLTNRAGRHVKENIALAMAFASRPAQILAARSATARRVLPYGSYLAGLADLPLARVKLNFYDAINAPRRVLFSETEVAEWIRATGFDVTTHVCSDAKSRTWIGRRPREV
jgi:SAM-dependent methyltransferase